MLRDGEAYDRIPFESEGPASLELEAHAGPQQVTGNDRICARVGETALIAARLFDESGRAVEYADPGWKWERDAEPANGGWFYFTTLPAGLMRTTASWDKLSATVVIEGLPAETLAAPGFTCGG